MFDSLRARWAGRTFGVPGPGDARLDFDGEKLPLAGHALQGSNFPIGKLEIRSDYEIPYRAGDEDLTSIGEGSHASGDVNGDARDVGTP